jgi:hypothetical protein
MKRVGDEVAYTVHDRAVAGKAAKACEAMGHDEERNVPGAAGRAGMAAVQVAVDAQLDTRRVERREARAE